MTPEERNFASETLLREHGVAINPTLPLIESDDEVVLRSRDEVLQRFVALWAVVGSAFLEGNAHFRDYIVQGQLESWLSKRELAFLLGDDRTRTEIIQFTWKLECLYFLVWAAGLIKTVE
jgi:Domain of unknown function (DUF4272)